MTFSKYTLEARVYPTIIGLIPFYLLQYYYLSNFIFSDLVTAKIVGNVSVSLIVLYFVTELVVRYPSKILEDKLFNNKLNFPTTNFLLFGNDEYTKSFKRNVRLKVKNDFSLMLLDEQEEFKDEKEARMRIKEAVGVMIKFVKDGHLVLKHNISYGFFRNLWGASLVGIIFSVILVYISWYSSLSKTGIGFGIFYLLYVLLGNRIIKYFGESYARKLIEEYFEKHEK